MKELIIKKANDLGFTSHYRVANFIFCEKKGKYYYLFLDDMMFGIFNGSYNDLRKIESPEQLENLFKSISE